MTDQLEDVYQGRDTSREHHRVKHNENQYVKVLPSGVNG